MRSLKRQTKVIKKSIEKFTFLKVVVLRAFKTKLFEFFCDIYIFCLSLNQLNTILNEVLFSYEFRKKYLPKKN